MYRDVDEEQHRQPYLNRQEAWPRKMLDKVLREIGDHAAGSEEMDEPLGEPHDQYAQPVDGTLEQDGRRCSWAPPRPTCRPSSLSAVRCCRWAIAVNASGPAPTVGVSGRNTGRTRSPCKTLKTLKAILPPRPAAARSWARRARWPRSRR